MSIILPTCVLFQLVVGADLALRYWPEIILGFHGYALLIWGTGCIAKCVINHIVNHVGALYIKVGFILVSQLMITLLPDCLAKCVFAHVDLRGPSAQQSLTLLPGPRAQGDRGTGGVT